VAFGAAALLVITSAASARCVHEPFPGAPIAPRSDILVFRAYANANVRSNPAWKRDPRDEDFSLSKDFCHL
jgi:hypothetical protein